MLDMGRVTEKKEYYTVLLPWLAKWGYNTLHLHLADDQRCALQFPSRPELATAGAFTAAEMKLFVRAARQHGLAVMPEIECLGHTRFITEHVRYRSLAEPGLKNSGFSAICPAHPETRAILRDVIRDTADIFDHPVIHVGLDEVLFGACPRCRAMFGAKAEAARRFSRHTKWVHDEVRRAGRRPAMWADHVIHSDAIRKEMGRDVLMFHWNYLPDFPMAQAAPLLDHGFEVICCPATVCWLTRLVPGAKNLANLRSCSARAALLTHRGVRGIDNTVWCPWRYLPGAVDFGIAFAGHLMQRRDEDPAFPARFAKTFYGVQDVEDAGAIGQALTELSAAAFDNEMTGRIVCGTFGGETFNREDRRWCRIVASRTRALVADLKRRRGAVRKNIPRYDDVTLSAETILALARHGASGRKSASRRATGRLLNRAVTAWGRDRHADDSFRKGNPRHHGADAILRILEEVTP